MNDLAEQSQSTPGSAVSQSGVAVGALPPHSIDAQMWRWLMARAGRAVFRGEIWEYFKEVPMGRGLENQGEPFDIETAAYLKPVLRAIRERSYGKFVIKAAVQMLKTFGCIEMPVGYFIDNEPGDMTVYFPVEDAAGDQAKGRTMPFLKSVPGVKEAVDRAEEANRFDITNTEFYLPGMILRLRPLNESNTQRVTLRYVFISDAFLAAPKMIGEAIARTTQHNTLVLKDYKIVIESQGGEDGDDFDQEWQSTNQQALQVRCPCCGMGQRFEWYRERDETFRAVVPIGRVKEILADLSVVSGQWSVGEIAAVAEASGLTPEAVESLITKGEYPLETRNYEKMSKLRS